jgi:ribonuclease P protein component
MPRRQSAVETIARLVDSADFERVLRSASRASTEHFAVHHLSAGPGAAAKPVARASGAELSTEAGKVGARAVDDSPAPAAHRGFGVVVPKRHARRSVTRSLLKRQIYAAADRHLEALASGLWIVRLRAPFDRAAYCSAASMALRRAARAELDSLFRAAVRKQLT